MQTKTLKEGIDKLAEEIATQLSFSGFLDNRITVQSASEIIIRGYAAAKDKGVWLSKNRVVIDGEVYVNEKYIPEPNQSPVDLDSFAIGFAEWKDKNYLNQSFPVVKDGEYFHRSDLLKHVSEIKLYTIKELLQLYKSNPPKP